MAYDVFLVSAKDDADVAKLIARRLRALKFKVWYDAKYEDETFDAKEAKAATESQSMVVLWSAASVKSDWVRAAASVGHSRRGVLVQTALDKTVPYEPFKADKRFPIDGMNSRKTPEGFFLLVEELGRRDGRTDLRQWINFAAKEDDKRAAWLTAHPSDPLARPEPPKRPKVSASDSAAAAAAVGAAGLAASVDIDDTASLDLGNAPGLTGRGTDEDDETIRRISSYAKGANTTSAQPAARATTFTQAPTIAATAAPGTIGQGIGPRLNPPGSKPLETDNPSEGTATLRGVCGAIGLMMLAGWFVRSEPIAPVVRTAALPAIANAQFPSCPAGQVPESLVRTLEHGTIVDDTP